MPSVRVLAGVLHNFLGTWTSRYTTWDGYWLFGFLLPAVCERRIDLLEPAAPPPHCTPIERAVASARSKFAGQLGKARFPREGVAVARVSLRRGATSWEQVVGAEYGRRRAGWDVRVEVVATSTSGRSVSHSCALFVGPHDPPIESRSSGAPSDSAGSG